MGVCRSAWHALPLPMTSPACARAGRRHEPDHCAEERARGRCGGAGCGDSERRCAGRTGGRGGRGGGGVEVGGVGGGKTGRARGREKEDMGGGVDRGKGGRGGGGRGQDAVVTRTGVGEQGEYKRTALMWASEKGMTNMVEKLLAAGAKAETTDGVKREEERVGGGRRRAGEGDWWEI